MGFQRQDAKHAKVKSRIDSFILLALLALLALKIFQTIFPPNQKYFNNNPTVKLRPREGANWNCSR